MAEATNEQMKMAFMDDGMERDPISGNEIPTGSLAEEVRDDVPAMLSEGEYVVPADVLRFYGIKFFEDLRIKAKDGLARMDSMGRIGGEPIEEESAAPTMPTSEDSNVLPFSVEELETEEEEIEMAVGGVIKAAEGTLVEKGIETMFSPAGMAVGLSPAAAILANATGADKKIYKALFDSTATFTGRDRGPVITGTASENKGKFYRDRPFLVHRRRPISQIVLKLSNLKYVYDFDTKKTIQKEVLFFRVAIYFFLIFFYTVQQKYLF